MRQRATNVHREWIVHLFKGRRIRQQRSTGFFSANDLCRAGKRRWTDYTRLASTKNFVRQVTRRTRRRVVVVVKNGPNERRGSWISPMLVTHLAMWISSDFAFKVTSWIEQWKALSPAHDKQYTQALVQMKPDPILGTEMDIRDWLRQQLNARTEVRCRAGFIDLVIPNSAIVEVKEASKWKDALGKVMAYSACYPEDEEVAAEAPPLRKVIYLFGDLSKIDVQLVREVYAQYDVELKLFRL